MKNQLKFLNTIKGVFDENKAIDLKSLKVKHPQTSSFDYKDVEKAFDGKMILNTGDIVDPLKLSTAYDMFEFEYSNQYTDGFWDLKVSEDFLPKNCLIEYKSSINEMPIDDVLIQIKKRRECVNHNEENSELFSSELGNLDIEDNWYENQDYKTLVVSFDSRFEKYRRILWNEGIDLLLLDFEDFEDVESKGYIHNNACSRGD